MQEGAVFGRLVFHLNIYFSMVVVDLFRYMVLPSQAGLQYKKIGKSDYLDDSNRIFYRVGIMLHGKHSFCTKLAIIIKVR